jgi:hypothetical protein
MPNDKCGTAPPREQGRCKIRRPIGARPMLFLSQVANSVKRTSIIASNFFRRRGTRWLAASAFALAVR